jgi:hydroxyacylglutathione hydrolase
MCDQRFRIRGMDIIPLPAFRDNYIWLLRSGQDAAVVDPGDAAVVEAYLAAHGLRLRAVLVTHHHADHVGGVEALRARHAVPVFGPRKESIAGVDHPLGEGDRVRLPGLDASFQVLDVPGHTPGHIAYLGEGLLFCGDTLFSAGCGRLLGGTAAQLYASLQRLAALPEATVVYCTHEYTLANLEFARAAEPDNPAREAHAQWCEARRAAQYPTLPSSIGVEKRINPFLRTDQAAVRRSVEANEAPGSASDADYFAALRRWKDRF